MLALAWGAAEAAVFFIVADVVIGWIALRHGFRAGAIAAVAATLGATAGGAALYQWSARDSAAAARLLEAGPAVSAGAVARAGPELTAEDGRGAMLRAAFSGKPYRLYAAAAPGAGMSMGQLAVLTPVVRAPRFLLIALIFGLLGRALRPRLSMHVLAALHLGGWAVFYALYWLATPW